MGGKFERTVLVTGGAGFIGSTYLNICVPLYPRYELVCVDALTAIANKKNIEVANCPNFTFVKCDIRDEKALAKVVKKHRPTDVIHFAAETHVDVSIEKPNIFVETNVLGTVNLLNLSRAFGVKMFLHISTDEVYGALGKTDAAFTEKSPLSPNSPYSASKAAAEHFVRAYQETYGLDAIIVRMSNNYGPRQDATKLIPLFITNLLANKKVPLYATGDNVRDWLYVDDCVEAIDLVFHKGKAGEIYNIGGGTELRNIDVTRDLLAQTGHGDEMIQYVTDRPGHDFRYALNTAKIKKALGWKAQTPFDLGVKKTIDFYRTRPKKR